ncbi:unnamed protein product [Ceratitis capitata]|uniref:(Mediterranean fruit fly) hypothetical protein n=1 Tax=Ceratitis capitata TaxID=7213 RepID=A0A811UWL8_CERCA|nr:unnamed protein product [Ceratitis capitata]
MYWITNEQASSNRAAMEDLRSTVTNLTGAVKAILEKKNSLKRRVVRLDTISAAVTMSPGARSGDTANTEEIPLQAPANEADLKDISRLSDCVKEL